MKKRFISALLAMLMLMTMVPVTAFGATIVDSGTCGTNVTWTLDSEGALTISGSGAMETYATWYSQRSYIKTVTVALGVTSIDNAAFSHCSNLTSVTIPNSVTTIGDDAFGYCYRLISVVIGDNVTTIGNAAFVGCSSLTTVTIPDSVTSIGESAFYDCDSLTTVTIPDSITSIGDWAFCNCDSLTSVTIGNSVTTNVDSAFDNLSSFTVASNNPAYSNDSYGVLFNKDKTILVQYPLGNPRTSYTIPESVTTISDWAFWSCESLTTVTIPDSVITIGNSAFEHCRSLTTVTIPDSVTTIGDWAFDDCDSLTAVTIPDSVTSIGYGAFWGCESLTTVTIPDSVTSIGHQAFMYCYSLTNVYYTGTQAQWENIQIDSSSGFLISATIHYNYVPEMQRSITVSTENYYIKSENCLFRVAVPGAPYPSPAGFAVNVGSSKYTSGASTCVGTDDITASVPTGYTGNITVSKSGYHTCTIPASLTGQYNTVAMYPTSVTKPFAQMLLMDKSQGSYASYRNLLVENETVYEVNPLADHKQELLSFYAAVNWNGHGAGTVALVQEENEIPLNNQQMTAVNWSAHFFAANKPVYLCITAADGTTSRTQVGLTIYKPMDSGIKINLGETITANTAQAQGDTLSILEGKSLKIDFKELSNGLIPINFTIKKDGTIEGVIGIQLDKESDAGAVFGSMKNSLDRLKNQSAEDSREIAKLLKEMQQYGVPKPLSSEFGISGSATVLGYFTGKIADGRVGLTESKIVLCFDGKLSYTHNTEVYGVPAYFKIGLSTKIERYFKMIYDEQLKQLESDGKDHLDASISLSGEVGPGWSGYLSGGVKSSGKIKMKGQVPISVPTTSFSMSASFSFVGNLRGIEGEWTFYETPEKIFWDAGEFCWKEPANKSALQYFVPNLQMTPMTMLGAPNAIATGVSGYTSPTLAQLSDGRLLAVWVVSVPGRSAVDKNGVWYSIFDGSTWSQAQLVSDDGTNDAVPQLYHDSDTVYLAWQNYTTTFDTDVLPDYDTLSAQMVTVVSTFDETEDIWSTPVQAEPDWYLAEPTLPEDYEDEWPDSFSARTVLTYGDNRAVLYLADDENECAQVFGLFHDGYNWGQPIQLTAVSGGIDGFSAVMDEDSVQILYTSGDYADAALSMTEVDLQADMAVTDVDYIRQTFVPGNELTLVTTVKNESPVTVNGVHVRVLKGSEEVHSENISVRFDSGEEDILYVNYTLPETIDFSQLKVEVTPLNAEDADTSDNAGVCALCAVDLSAENPAAQIYGDMAKVVAQVVNRGRENTEATVITLYKNAPDGDVLATREIPAMEPGELMNIEWELDSLAADDMVYMAIAECGEENLIGNNTTQAVVLAEKVKEYDTGDCNGDDDVDVTDMTCLYTWLSTGKNEGSLDTKAFQKIADINGDSVINILDYQALYELIKQHP